MKLGFGSESWDDDDDVISPALFKPHFELPALTNIIEISQDQKAKIRKKRSKKKKRDREIPNVAVGVKFDFGDDYVPPAKTALPSKSPTKALCETHKISVEEKISKKRSYDIDGNAGECSGKMAKLSAAGSECSFPELLGSLPELAATTDKNQSSGISRVNTDVTSAQALKQPTVSQSRNPKKALPYSVPGRGAPATGSRRMKTIPSGKQKCLQVKTVAPSSGRKSKMSIAVQRLQAAKFRMLNEQLYTTRGDQALSAFAQDPELFRIYHDGFATQVKKWPVNPVDTIIEWLDACSQELTVADFGCGEAKIAQSVQNTVHSYDLVAANEHVVACDIANVPLEDASIDVGIFCLSLMGTNFVDYLREAHRVIVDGGRLKIAEVVSRIDDCDAFIDAVESVGFTVIARDERNKMFIALDFEKTTSIQSGSIATTEIFKNGLKPCIYKRR